MAKFIKGLLILFTVFAVLAGGLVTVLLYWKKILSYATAAKNLTGNILNTFAGDTLKETDAEDYYDI